MPSRGSAIARPEHRPALCLRFMESSDIQNRIHIGTLNPREFGAATMSRRGNSVSLASAFLRPQKWKKVPAGPMRVMGRARPYGAPTSRRLNAPQNSDAPNQRSNSRAPQDGSPKPVSDRGSVIAVCQTGIQPGERIPRNDSRIEPPEPERGVYAASM